MHGIDISHWQKGFEPNAMLIDFCICKATEGKNYKDTEFTIFADKCIKRNILFGFYHFARKNTPEKEAEFFYNSCKNYFGKGIPILDYEVVNKNNVQWCERFIQKVYDLSGVWCVIYISASKCGEYENSWIPNKCGLWVAGYPKTYTNWIDSKVPYNIYPFKKAIIWQFTNSLKIQNFKVDGDIAYITKEEWKKYYNSNISKSIDDLVLETILGEYGSGKERKKMLGKNYVKVQKRINELYKIADEVLKGYWGNGNTRKQKLEKEGYPYAIIQKIVNIKLRKDK